MKRKVIRTLTISTLSLVGSTAFAQENSGEKVALDTSDSTGSSLISQEQIDALKKEVLKKDPTENAIKAYGLIQFSANAYDSQRVNTPDFKAEKIRFGLQVAGGIASGQFEVQFNGNQQDLLSDKNKTQSDGTVTIRRAQLNLDVLNVKSPENSYLTTVSIGGIRVGGADNTAPDAALAPNGYARQDGVYIKETITLGKKINSEIGLGAFNNLTSYSPSSIGALGGAASVFSGVDDTANSIPSNWTSNSFNSSLAYLGNIKVGYNFDDERNLTAQVFYGAQNNAPNDQDLDGKLTTIRDISHIEASLVYSDNTIFGSKGVISTNGVSFWYEGETAGRSYKATSNNSGDFSYATATAIDDSRSSNLYGLGFAGDTGNYLSGMMQKGDRLTYGLSYALVTSTYTNQGFGQNYKVNQATASVGYAVNTFEVALIADIKNADKVAFKDSNGNVTNKDSSKVYVTALYSF